MEQIRIPDIGTSDSDDFAEDYWFTSPSASIDGSSVNSIPWADDVVKQNQELWDRIEQMFYAEEALPINDDKLRDEIIEWNQHFPHLRINGKATSMYCNANALSNDGDYEEIILIHPPSEHFDRKSARIATLNNQSVNERFSCSSKDEHQTNTILINDMERCLRITSGPLLIRRIQNKTASGIRTIAFPVNNSSKQNSNKQQYFKSDGQQYASNFFRSIDAEPMHSIPYSARIINIPSMKCDVSDLNTVAGKSSNIIRIKTATLIPINRPIRNSITLPSINIEPKYFEQQNNHNIGASISALIYPDSKSVYTSFKRTIKKRSESE